MLKEPNTVAVAMSGGVDSSVAAALLVEQGYTVFGLMLRLWSEPGYENSNKCCTPDAMAQARKVAAQIGIPFYAVNAQEIFREQVVQFFLDGYSAGVTPNPCLVCNQSIRWGYLLDYALKMGADAFATGHYARVLHEEDGPAKLLKGIDEKKDQSYVLSILSQEQLGHTLLPVGGYVKPHIRELARKFNLPVAERQDSQDLCFLAGRDYRQFLSRYVPESTRTGNIVNSSGKILGQHEGLAFYTIGQRKGLGVPSETPLYVLAKDNASNNLVVGQLSELGQSRLIANGITWLAGQPPATEFKAAVKIRYRAAFVDATIAVHTATDVEVAFDHPMRDITPGQRVVFYDGDLVLGGGTIQKAFTN